AVGVADEEPVMLLGRAQHLEAVEVALEPVAVGLGVAPFPEEGAEVDGEVGPAVADVHVLEATPLGIDIRLDNGRGPSGLRGLSHGGTPWHGARPARPAAWRSGTR